MQIELTDMTAAFSGAHHYRGLKNAFRIHNNSIFLDLFKKSIFFFMLAIRMFKIKLQVQQNVIYKAKIVIDSFYYDFKKNSENSSARANCI